MPSHDFFGTIVVDWSYDSAKGELTVSALLNGKSMTGSPVVLTHTSHTAAFNGQDGNNSAVVNLDGDFATRMLTASAAQTHPQKSGTNTGNF